MLGLTCFLIYLFAQFLVQWYSHLKTGLFLRYSWILTQLLNSIASRESLLPQQFPTKLIIHGAKIKLFSRSCSAL
ncbi:unnamed protein product [Ceratitis capitata]|uniref:(Mediterranean fruit fly) hypothetical protein n=1 Tax=Ceratitis capitata TaxID=7213 RepID=A0A811VEK4_CERCA|nr:unnamed protein product [Ceratitis capitata]